MSARKVILSIAVLFVALVACIFLSVRVKELPAGTFRGHTSPVRAVVASPDGKTVASMSEDETIKVWDVATHKERATLRGGNGTISFSSDGKFLAWREDRTIRSWELATGKERVTFRGHSGDVCKIAFSPDGKTMASGSCDHTVKLWDVATGKERATYREHTSSVCAVTFSPDGKTLASAGYGPDGTIKLWDVTTGEVRSSVRAHGWHGDSLTFSPDGKSLASAEASLRLWDVATGRNFATLEISDEGVESVMFSPDGKTLAALSAGKNEVDIWDAVSGKKIATWEKEYRRPRPRLLRYIWDTFPSIFEEHAFVTLSISFKPDGNIVAWGFDNRDGTTVEAWQLAGVPRRKE